MSIRGFRKAQRHPWQSKLCLSEIERPPCEAASKTKRSPDITCSLDPTSKIPMFTTPHENFMMPEQ